MFFRHFFKNHSAGTAAPKADNYFFTFYALFLFWFSFVASCISFFFGYVLFFGIFLLISFTALLLFFYFSPFKIFSPIKSIFSQIKDFLRQNLLLFFLWMISLFFYLLFLLGMVEFDWDLSKENIFSLSDSSRKIAQSIKHPVDVFYFSLPSGEAYKELNRVLENFARENQNIRPRMIHLAHEGEAALRLGVRQQGELVFLVEGKVVARIFPSDLVPKKITMWGQVENLFNYEQALAKTLATVNRKYFLKIPTISVGFMLPFRSLKTKKNNLDQIDVNALAKNWRSFSNLLERSGFDARFYYPQEKNIESFLMNDVVIVDASDFLLQKMEAALLSYLRRGGRVLFLFDVPSQYFDKRMKNFSNLSNPLNFLKIFGLQSANGIVVDKENISPYLSFLTDQSPAPRLPAYPHFFYADHPITTFLINQSLPPFFAGTIGFFPRVPNQLKNKKKSSLDIKMLSPLVLPTAAAWSENDYENEMKTEGTVFFHPNVDSHSAKWMAVAANFRYGEKDGRAVFLGDSQFLQDRFIDVAGNKNFALNIVQWLAGKDGDLTGAFSFKKRYWQIIAYDGTQRFLFFLFCVVILPLLIFSSALFVFVRKRLLFEEFLKKEN